jgi:4-amino-4-deoxy-L-arabinose transferase-like glycosyltransferase
MPHHRWDDPIDRRSAPGGLALILVGAAALRFWALGHGIPFAVGADEPQIMERVVRMMKTGDLNPHFFEYPGLYLHAQLVVACLRFLAGALAGRWASLDAVSAADFYLWARALSALLGTATVWLVYRAGLHWGTRHALVAAGLMAVVPQHVRESHYVATDIPLTFFTTLALIFSLDASERPSSGAFARAGLAAGLAGASKYPGLLALSLPLVAAASLRATPLAPSRAALIAVASGAGAFVAAAPYTWLDLPGFLNGFAYMASHHAAPAADGGGWRTYLIHLRLALGWPGLILLFAGLAMAIERGWRGPGRARWWMLLVFGMVYFYLLATRAIIFGRYLLPLYPIVCLLLAAAIVSGVGLLRRFEIPRIVRQALIAALALAALVPPAVTAIGFDRRIGRPSTQSLAYAWILAHIPAGARIVIEGQALWLPGDRYRVTHVRRLIEKPLAEYAAQGVDYLIASSEVYGGLLAHPEQHPREAAAYRRLLGKIPPLVVFAATPERPGPDLRIIQASVVQEGER